MSCGARLPSLIVPRGRPLAGLGAAGTSQHTLLRNRLKALRIAKAKMHDALAAP